MNITKHAFRRYGPLVVLVAMLLGALNVIWRPFEPRYGGKRLSAWAEDLIRVDSYGEDEVPPEIQAGAKQASKAIQQMGHRAIPYALKSCRAEGDEEQSKGLAVFRALGPAARPAIPALIEWFNKNPQIAIIASGALQEIGTDSIAPLTAALTNASLQMRMCAATTLGGFGAQARSAAPELLRCLNDEDPSVRSRAASALAYVGDPTTVVPALVSYLEKETNNVKFSIPMALAHLGSNARPVVPLGRVNK